MSQHGTETQALSESPDAERVDDSGSSAEGSVDSTAATRWGAPYRELKPVTETGLASQTPTAAGGEPRGVGRDESHAQSVGGSTPLLERLEKLESQNRWMRVAIFALLCAVAYGAFLHFAPDAVTVKQTLMESKELKLVDSDGNTRVFLRMYSHVPVLQLLDSNGKPRLSIGMRFDNTPFIDLSDKSGRTRATLEMTPNDQPALRLYDAKGHPTFKLN